MQPRNMALSAPLRTISLLLLVSCHWLGVVSEEPNNTQPALGPCAKVGGKFRYNWAVLPSEYRACLRTFAFRPGQAQSLLDTIWKVIVKIYPYINISRDSPSNKLFLQARPRRDLFRIRRKFATYKYDFDFHRDLYLVFKSLNDAHTFWEPSCYMAGYVQSGLPVVQVYDPRTDTVKIKVAPVAVLITLSNLDVFTFTEKRIGVNPLELGGAEVVRIGGLPALDYVNKLARKVGGFRDQQARINSLFLRPDFDSSGTLDAITDMSLGELQAPAFLPDNDTLSYTIRRVGSNIEETLDIPYFVFYDGADFNTNGEYYAINCRARYSAASSALLGEKAFVPRHLQPDRPWRRRQKWKVRKAPDVALGNGQGLQTVSEAADYFKVFLLPATTIAVLVIPDFVGAEGPNVPDTFAQLFTAYEQLQALAATRLLIHVADNPGGYAMAGAYLANLLFPGAGDPQLKQQLKAPPFVLEAVRAAAELGVNGSDYSWQNYEFAGTDAPIPSPDQFFYPLVNLTQAGITESFSSLFRLTYTFSDYDEVVDDTGTDTTYETLPSTPLFAPRNILILSNGLCFSTCHIFTTILNQLRGVRIVTLGGKQTEGPFMYGAGAAGWVVPDYNDYYKVNVVDLGLQNLPSAPRPLPVAGTLGFTLAQAYNLQNTTIPAEFVYTPSQLHIKHSDQNVLSLLAQWRDAAKFFDA